jgi:hypothetical protein
MVISIQNEMIDRNGAVLKQPTKRAGCGSLKSTTIIPESSDLTIASLQSINIEENTHRKLPSSSPHHALDNVVRFALLHHIHLCGMSITTQERSGTYSIWTI